MIGVLPPSGTIFWSVLRAFLAAAEAAAAVGFLLENTESVTVDCSVTHPV